MKKILRVGEKGKSKLATEERQLTSDLQTRVEVIQALIPLGLEAVKDLLIREVEQLAGVKYSRTGGLPGHYRIPEICNLQRQAVRKADGAGPVGAGLCRPVYGRQDLCRG